MDKVLLDVFFGNSTDVPSRVERYERDYVQG